MIWKDNQGNEREDCPMCGGGGQMDSKGQLIECPLCKGKGWVTPTKAQAYRRGKKEKEKK